MNIRQNNKYNMYGVVIDHCSHPDHAAAVGQLAAFQREYNAFAEIPDQINDLARIQEVGSHGKTRHKNGLRRSMGELSADVAASVQAYADVAGDAELFASVDYTVTSFTRGRQAVGANRAEIVLPEATKHLADLADYGVDQAQLDALDEAIEQYSDSIGKPREHIVGRKVATDTLPALFEKADQHLGRLDRLARQLQRQHADFVMGYRNARTIVNTGTGPRRDSRVEVDEEASVAMTA